MRSLGMRLIIHLAEEWMDSGGWGTSHNREFICNQPVSNRGLSPFLAGGFRCNRTVRVLTKRAP